MTYSDIFVLACLGFNIFIIFVLKRLIANLRSEGRQSDESKDKL